MKTNTTIRLITVTGDRQLCTHALTGRAPVCKMCAQNYECGSCEFDQMLDDLSALEIRRPAAGARTVRAA
jgi:hypothetical protein